MAASEITGTLHLTRVNVFHRVINLFTRGFRFYRNYRYVTGHSRLRSVAATWVMSGYHATIT